MINFIVCEDNSKIRSNIANIIDTIMMKNDKKYSKLLYEDYNDSFINLINKKRPSTIYILDIETKSGSGIEIAREIRKKDYDSLIIFLTAHEELGYVILKNEFMFLAFISKFDDYESKLKNTLEKALKLIDKKGLFELETPSAKYNIPYDDILHIDRDTFDRKLVIHTDYSKIVINKTLQELETLLPAYFKRVHKSSIINNNRIIKIDYGQKNILFDNGKVSELLSRKYRE